MYPILFSIGKINVYTHGLLIAIGAIAGGLVIYYLAKKKGMKTNFIFDIIVYSLLGGLIGARLLYVILYYNQFNNFKEMLYIWYGGLVSFGGMAGGLLVAFLFLRAKKEKVLEWFDIGAIGLMVGWAFGRVGCLLTGDSFGIITQSKIAIWGRIPTQIFESIWALIVAVILWFGLKIQVKWQLPDGVNFTAAIGLYSLGRFVIDFWREEPVTVWFLKTGQLGSLILFLISILVIFLMIKKVRRSYGSF